MTKPWVQEVEWTSYVGNGVPHIVRVRSEVDGATGTVDVHVIPQGGLNLWGRFDVARIVAKPSGAPRGWNLFDRQGGVHHIRDMRSVLDIAGGWVLDEARMVLKGR